MTVHHRVAFVVYNDVYRDSRVLKMADSAAERGHAVRVFAFGGPLSHSDVGIELRPSGAEILRLGLLPDRLPGARRVLASRRDRLATSVTAAGASAPASEASRARPFPRLVARLRVLGFRTAVSVLQVVRAEDFAHRASRAVRRWNPDLIHAHDANTLVAALRVHRAERVPFVYDAHELWESRNAQRGRWARRQDRRLLDRASRRMAGSVTVSPGIQAWMADRYRLAQPPTLVRNIPPAQVPIPERSDGMLRERTGLPEEARVIVYVGRITTGRGIPETIDALQLLPLDIHFVLLGYGADSFVSRIRAHAESLGLADRVHFAGSVESEQVPRAIADADASIVYTQPLNLSYTLSLPNKLFESIHAGQAIVASDLPDVAQLVREYGLGQTFPPGDVEVLAAAISRVLAAPEEFRAASRRAAQDLTWDGEMDRLFALYEQVLHGNSNASHPAVRTGRGAT